MAFYEHTFIGRQDLTQQAVEAVVENIKGILEANNSKLVNFEYWGVKTLTFRIAKNRKGHYAYLTIDGNAAAINEIERQHRINEDVLRYLTVRVDAHEEGPSAMMQKRDRDDRGDRPFGDRDRGPRSFGDRDRGDRGPRSFGDRDRGDRGGDRGGFGGGDREDRPRRPREEGANA